MLGCPSSETFSCWYGFLQDIVSLGRDLIPRPIAYKATEQLHAIRRRVFALARLSYRGRLQLGPKTSRSLVLFILMNCVEEGRHPHIGETLQGTRPNVSQALEDNFCKSFVAACLPTLCERRLRGHRHFHQTRACPAPVR